MKAHRILGLALASVLGLTACGGTGSRTDTGAGSASASGSAAAAEPAAAETFTFEHAGGTTEVPVDPQRIVTLQDQNGMLPLLELGVKPVGSAALDNGDGTYRFRRVDNHDSSGIAFVGAYGEPDLELVAAQQPDLIIGTEFNDGIHPQLSEIAPTVLIQIFDRPLTEALADFAELVGRQERHAELHASYGQAIADLVADLPRPPDDIVLSNIQFAENGQFYIEHGQAVGTVLDDVGFARPDAEIAAMSDPEYDYSSFETIVDHDADVMITGDFSADYGEATEAPEITAARKQPVFERLEVVQRGEFHVFDGNHMVGSAYEKMMNFIDFLRSTLVDRESALAVTEGA